jgi:hypothetical protein
MVGEEQAGVGAVCMRVFVCVGSFGWGADDKGQAGSATAKNTPFGWAGQGQPVTQLTFPASAGVGYQVVDVGAGFFHGYALTCAPL